MSPRQLASLVCHYAAGELLRHGIDAPEAPVEAIILETTSGTEILVIVRPKGVPGVIVAPVSAPVVLLPAPAPVAKLPPLQERIADLLRGGPSRKAAWIAQKLRRAYSGSFRSTLAEMVRAGVLNHANGGYSLE